MNRILYILILFTLLFSFTYSSNSSDINDTTYPLDDAEGKVIYRETNFIRSFFAAVSIILFSETFDKTFFILAILAMKNDRKIVYLGGILALSVMTVLSAMMGFALPLFVPHIVTDLLATFLFMFFGVQNLWNAYKINPTMSETAVELQSAKEELTDFTIGSSVHEDAVLEEGGNLVVITRKRRFNLELLFQIFWLTFFAEWGDRSQIATIAMAAADNAFGVTLGTIVGHSICSAIAVLSGRFIAKYISERSLNLFSGFLFLVFAFHSVHHIY